MLAPKEKPPRCVSGAVRPFEPKARFERGIALETGEAQADLRLRVLIARPTKAAPTRARLAGSGTGDVLTWPLYDAAAGTPLSVPVT